MLPDLTQKHSRTEAGMFAADYPIIIRSVDPSESRALFVYFYHAPNFTTQFTPCNNGWFQDRPGMPFATIERSLRSVVLARQTDAILRKEVIQPHLPIRLPCYDFVPLAPHTLDGWLLAVTPPASGADNSGDVTGGVYKARERIQRSLADLRLLAIPASCRRVAACNPN